MRNQKLNAKLILAVAAAVGGLSASSATAQDASWNIITAGSWSTAGNWTTSNGTPLPPSGAGLFVTINTNISAARIITLDGARTVGRLDIGDSNNTHLFTLAAGTGGSLTLDSGATNTAAQLNHLDTGKIDVISAPITLNSNLTATNSSANAMTVSGAITGSKDITFAAGDWTLSSTTTTNSAFSGDVYINAGTVKWGGDNALNSANTVYLQSGGTMDLGNRTNTTVAGLADGASVGGIVTNSGASARTLNLSGAGSYSYGGQITGNMGLNVTAGTHGLTSSNNTYSQTTKVSTGGILEVTSASNGLGDNTTAAITLDGGVLRLLNNNSVTYGSTSNPNGYDVSITTGNGGTVHVDRLDGSNTGNTLKLDTLSFRGVFNVTGANGYNLELGSVAFNNTSANTSTLNPTSANLLVGAVNGVATGTANNVLALDGTSTGNVITGPVNNGAAGAVVKIVKQNISTWSLGGVSNYTGGTAITNGTLKVMGDAPASGNGALGSSVGGVVSVGNAVSTIPPLPAATDESVALLIGGAHIIGRDVLVNFNNSTGSSTLGGSNTSGLAQFSGNITLNRDVTLTAAANGAVEFNTGTWTSNDNAVTVSGGGVVRLANTLNTIAAVNVNSGKLLVNGVLGGGGSAVSVASGAVLGGNGSIDKDLSISGTLAPGDGIGILASGSVSFAGPGASFAAQVAGAGVAGVNFDQLQVTGGVDLAGAALALDLSGLTLAANQFIPLIVNDGTDAVISTFAGLNDGAIVLTQGAYNLRIAYSGEGNASSGGNDVVLYSDAVPEPAAALLLATGSLLALGRRRRSIRA